MRLSCQKSEIFVRKHLSYYSKAPVILFESTHLEHGYFPLCEEAVTSARNVALGQSGETYAVECDNLVAHFLKYAAHNTVLSGVNLQTDVLAVFVGELQSIGDDLFVVQSYTMADRYFVLLFQVAVKNYRVDFLLAELGVSQFGSEVAVVGEQKHACCVAVEASYGVDALGAGVLDNIHNCTALLRIVGCGDAVLGFVEEYIYFTLAFDRLVVEHYLVGRQHFSSEAVHDLSVDCNHASLDEVVRFASAAEAGVGEVLVQTDGFSRILVSLAVLHLFALGVHAAVVLWLRVSVVALLRPVAAVCLAATGNTLVVTTGALVAVGRTLYACSIR